jgi:hypothetical protein
MFKQKLLNCEPIDLSRFVVNLRDKHLESWTPFSDSHPRERNSKTLTYHQWCALPEEELWSPILLIILGPGNMNLDLHQGVIHSVARCRLCVHTLLFKSATWVSTSSPACDLCKADDDDVQEY